MKPRISRDVRRAAGGRTVVYATKHRRYVAAPAPPRLPRIGPCRDPLALWFVEYEQDGQVFRRYYGNRAEARVALRQLKAAR